MRSASALVVGFVLMASGSGALAGIIAMNELPAEVRQSADRSAPGAKWLAAAKNTEKGTVYYKLLGKDPKNRLVQVQTYEDARLLDVRTTIPRESVPQVATDALAAQKPDFTPEEVQHVAGQHPDGRWLVYYRYQGKTTDGQKIVMCVGADGKKVFQEGK